MARFAFPFQLRQCPFRAMRAAADTLSPIFRLCRDYEAGVLSDWPEGFTATTVEAVYYVLEHRDAAYAAAARLE